MQILNVLKNASFNDRIMQQLQNQLGSEYQKRLSAIRESSQFCCCLLSKCVVSTGYGTSWIAIVSAIPLQFLATLAPRRLITDNSLLNRLFFMSKQHSLCSIFLLIWYNSIHMLRWIAMSNGLCKLPIDFKRDFNATIRQYRKILLKLSHVHFWFDCFSVQLLQILITYLYYKPL